MKPHYQIQKYAFERYLRQGTHPAYTIKGIGDNIDAIVNNIIAKLRAELNRASHWNTLHMSLHFYLGNGGDVTLSQIGQLDEIKQEYHNNYWPYFRNQIIERAMQLPDGQINDDFERGYYFYGTAFAHGKSQINGYYKGSIYTANDGRRYTEGTVQFEFYDTFTDPLSIRQILVEIIDNIPYVVFTEADLLDLIRSNTEFGGSAYNITGSWQSNIHLPL